MTRTNEALPSYSEWQSYHVFFVSPYGDEFRFEDETIGEDPEDGTETGFWGGCFGLSLTISLAAPVAAIGVSSFSHYEDGGYTIPDPMSSLYMSEQTGKVINANEYHRDWLGHVSETGECASGDHFDPGASPHFRLG
jgi:hypothetical protein